jgi:hypothetical protein
MTRAMSVAARLAAAQDQVQDLDNSEDDHEAQSPHMVQAASFPYTAAGDLSGGGKSKIPAALAVAETGIKDLREVSKHGLHPEKHHLAPDVAQGTTTHDFRQHDLLNTLQNHPLFAEANEKLAAWNSGNPEDREHALEQWCSNMYRNEDFRVLCRVLEGSMTAQLALTL